MHKYICITITFCVLELPVESELSKKYIYRERRVYIHVSTDTCK